MTESSSSIDILFQHNGNDGNGGRKEKEQEGRTSTSHECDGAAGDCLYEKIVGHTVHIGKALCQCGHVRDPEDGPSLKKGQDVALKRLFASVYALL